MRSMSIQTVTPGPVWQPALEFMSPKILAKQLENYGLMQSGRRSDTGTNELLIVGKEDRQDVEITIDTRTNLPKALKKYSHDSDQMNGARNCTMEVRFLWNRPIPAELFSPRGQAAKQ